MLFFSENKLHSHQICFAFGITRTLHHGLRFETIKKNGFEVQMLQVASNLLAWILIMQ